MMTAPWTLVGIGHDQSVEAPADRPVVVGRSAECDFVIADVTVSRRHAELTPTSKALGVRDLGSANGTRINGARITEGALVAGDTVSFGKVAFRCARPEPEPVPVPDPDSEPEGTVVRSLAVDDAGLDRQLRATQLARILDVAKRLGGEFELNRLIAAIVELSFDLLPVDRASLLLIDPESGELVPAASKSRFDDATAMRVPRSIARRAVLDKVPILTESAVDDERFRSGSVMLQSVRGAICIPLLVSADRVIGALYVDSLTANRPFREDEASMLFAFGGLAAVSLGKLTYAEEVRREAQVRSNFERFFAPGVAARIAHERGAIRLAGERRPVTILFSDIRGFTTIAETMEPDALGAFLTEYFTEMVDIVFELGGTLDKFIGDAILAVWGAPLAAVDDADRALTAAVRMQARIGVLNQRSRALGRPDLAIGIGINHGDVFAGYLGSERRLEYSVIGDSVNVASRLCDEAAPGEIRISATLMGKLRHPPRVERMPDVALRNRTQPVATYRVVP